MNTSKCGPFAIINGKAKPYSVNKAIMDLLNGDTSFQELGNLRKNCRLRPETMIELRKAVIYLRDEGIAFDGCSNVDGKPKCNNLFLDNVLDCQYCAQLINGNVFFFRCTEKMEYPAIWKRVLIPKGSVVKPSAPVKLDNAPIVLPLKSTSQAVSYSNAVAKTELKETTKVPPSTDKSFNDIVYVMSHENIAEIKKKREELNGLKLELEKLEKEKQEKLSLFNKINAEAKSMINDIFKSCPDGKIDPYAEHTINITLKF